MRTRSRLAAALAVTMLFLVSSASSSWAPEDGGAATPDATGDGPYLDREDIPSNFYPGEANDSEDFSDIAQLRPYGGGMRVSPGMLSGSLTTIEYTLHEGRRWDYLFVDISLDVTDEVYVSINEPGGTPGTDDLVQRTFNGPKDGVHLDLFDEDLGNHTVVFVYIEVMAKGTSEPPSILFGWELGECDADYWHDPFVGIDRDSARGDLDLGNGSVRPQLRYKPGGLYGKYYDNRDFSSLHTTRLDETIDFDFGNGPPASGMGRNTFSIRWEGKLLVPSTGTMWFHLTVDDGGRLWVDGDLIIDEWRDQSPTEFHANKYLSAGFHDIRIDYYENQGGAECQLRWSSASIPKRIVPHTALCGRPAENVLVSEDVTLPEGMVWDLLLLQRGGGNDPVVVEVLDAASGDPIIGFSSITGDVVDLSGIASGLYPTINLRATWPDGEVPLAQPLDDWGVKWMPERTWRCEFLSDIKLSGTVGLVPMNGYIQRRPLSEDTGTIAFAEQWDGFSHTVDSTLYQSGMPVTDITTTEAVDVEMADLDGDGVDDVLYASSRTNTDVVGYRGTAGGFDTDPTWTFEMQQGQGNLAEEDHQVLAADLDGDGGTDVAILSTNHYYHTQPQYIKVYHYNTSAGDWDHWNKTTIGGLDGAIGGFDAGDVNGDGLMELVLAVENGDDAGAVVLWGSQDYDTERADVLSPGLDVIAVKVGDLNGDDYADVTYSVNDTTPEHRVLYGSETGLTGQLSLGGDAATDIEFADWDGDGKRDILLLTEDTLTIKRHPFTPEGTNTIYHTIEGINDMERVRVGHGRQEGVALSTISGALGMDNLSWVATSIGWTGLYRTSLFTTGAVAVATGTIFGKGVGSLRSEVIDVGDISRVGSWGHVSHRFVDWSGIASQSQGIELRLIDAESGELLWNVTTSQKSASFPIPEAVSVREHPRVQLEALLTNLDEYRRLSLSHLEVNWTERVPMPPEVLSTKVGDEVIYRTNSTTVRITVDDEFDRPWELNLTLLVRDPDVLGWTDTHMSAAEWDGANWTSVFATTRDDPIGRYDIRVRATDSDGMDSDWFQLNDVVEVLNNPPSVPVVSLSPEAPLTGDDVRCVIDQQAYDRDSSYLEYIYVWTRDGEAVPSVEGDTVGSNLTQRGQVWRVAVRAYDGEDYGAWVNASVRVGNSPPELLSPLPDAELREDAPPHHVKLSSYFRDPDGDALEYSLSGLSNVSVDLDVAEDVASFTPAADWYGTETALFNVTDGMDWVTATLRIHVVPVNDEPRIVSIGGFGPNEGVFTVVTEQGSSDALEVVVEDPDSSIFYFRTDADHPRVTMIEGNGTIIFEPTNADVGEVSFNISVEDGSGGSQVVLVRIVVDNVNDRPGIVYIQQPRGGMEFVEGSTVLLQGSCSDPDEVHGQRLTFTWLSNVTGTIATGTTSSTSELPPGEHTITLLVSDGKLNSSRSVEILVSPKGGGGNGGGNGGGGGDVDDGPVGPGENSSAFVLVLVLILVILVVALYVGRRMVLAKRAGGDGLEEEDEVAPVGTGTAIPVEGPTSPDGRDEGDSPISPVFGSRSRPRPEDYEPKDAWKIPEATAEPTRPPAPSHPGPAPAARAGAGVWEEAPEEPPEVPRRQGRRPPPGEWEEV